MPILIKTKQRYRNKGMLIDRKDTEKADKGGIPLDAKAGNTLPPSQKQWRKGESRS